MATYGCCVTHGPDESHEEHMDRLWRQRNRELLERCRQGSLLGCLGFAQEEQARLEHKARLMELGQWPERKEEHV